MRFFLLEGLHPFRKFIANIASGKKFDRQLEKADYVQEGLNSKRAHIVSLTRRKGKIVGWYLGY